jgi:hypothetical protein
VITGVAWVAVVDCAADAARKLLSAAHVAESEQGPEGAVMVTVVPVTEQEPLAVMTAVVLAFVVAVTANVLS